MVVTCEFVWGERVAKEALCTHCIGKKGGSPKAYIKVERGEEGPKSRIKIQNPELSCVST